MFKGFAEDADDFFVAVLTLAIIAVIVGGGHADQFLKTAGDAVAKLIAIIQSPVSGRGGGGGTNSKPPATPSDPFTTWYSSSWHN